MSGRNEQSVEVTNFVHGITTTGNPRNIPRGGALKLVNGELIKNGIVSKVRGYTPISKWLDNRVYELLHFVRSGIDVVLVFGVNTGGTTGGVGMISGTWSSGLVCNTVLTGTSTSEVVSLLQAGDLAYFFDGTNDSYYDGSTWRDIGLTTPTSAATSSGTMDGALTDSGSYLCEIRRYNSSTGARSKPSPVSEAMIAGTAGANTAGLTIGFAAGDANEADFTEIYRTVASGTKMYREGSVSISATTFNMEMTDSTLTRQYRAEMGDDNPPKMKIVRVGGDEMVGVEVANPNRVRWCKYSDQFGTMYQSWPALNFADCEVMDRDEIKSIHYNNGTWYVFKDHSMGKLVDSGNGVRYFQKMADIGIVGVRAVTSFGRWVVWMSKTNIHITNGADVLMEAGGGQQGINIQDDIKNLAQGYGNRVAACTVPKRQQVRFSVVLSGQTYSKKVYFGHFQFWETDRIISWTTREQGPTPATYPGMQTASMAVIPDTSKEDQFIFGNSNGDGYIYKGDTGDSDNTKAIYSDWHFHRENLGDSNRKKTYSDFKCELKTENSSASVTIGIRRNGGDAVEILKTTTIGSAGFTLDVDALVADSNDPAGVMLSPETIETINVPCNREAQDVAVVIRNSDAKYIELRGFTQSGIFAGNQ